MPINDPASDTSTNLNTMLTMTTTSDIKNQNSNKSKRKQPPSKEEEGRWFEVRTRHCIYRTYTVKAINAQHAEDLVEPLYEDRQGDLWRDEEMDLGNGNEKCYLYEYDEGEELDTPSDFRCPYCGPECEPAVRRVP